MLAILKIHKITRKSAATTAAAACFTDYPAIVNYSIWSYYYVISFLILINILIYIIMFIVQMRKIIIFLYTWSIFLVLRIFCMSHKYLLSREINCFRDFCAPYTIPHDIESSCLLRLLLAGKVSQTLLVFDDLYRFGEYWSSTL